MWQAYHEMQNASCRVCSKYFHCLGNYNAVFKCDGDRLEKINTATRISNLPEWRTIGGGLVINSQQDQAAERFGRSGADCAALYLKSRNPLEKCGYNPTLKRC